MSTSRNRRLAIKKTKLELLCETVRFRPIYIEELYKFNLENSEVREEKKVML